MNYRQLGASDLKVSVVGLGNMSWPHCHFGHTPPPDAVIDRAAIREMVATALESGINLFDTAEGYGWGMGETLLGEALGQLGKRSNVIIVTKVGPLRGDEQVGGRNCDLGAANIQRRCEASLRRLQTDYIDLYLAHWPDAATPIEETMSAMAELKRQGKIRHFGVSNFDTARLGEALRHGPVAVNQLPYNLLNRDIDADQRPFCVRENVGIMAYSPLGKGMLSGKYDEKSLPPEEDYRHSKPYFFKQNLPRHFALAQRCRELATQLNITVVQLALAWCLAQPGITLVLPGSKRPAQVRENAGAGDVVLPEAVLAELNQASRD